MKRPRSVPHAVPSPYEVPAGDHFRAKREQLNFDVKAEARIWPRLSYMYRLFSTAVYISRKADSDRQTCWRAWIHFLARARSLSLCLSHYHSLTLSLSPLSHSHTHSHTLSLSSRALILTQPPRVTPCVLACTPRHIQVHEPAAPPSPARAGKRFLIINPESPSLAGKVPVMLGF